jgi:AcrR family transcriptional regulator
VRRDAAANRERILAAAQAVFGEQGEAGSTEEVARRAGVGIATVFRHFPTKEALVEAAMLRHFTRLTQQAGALAHDGRHEPAEALHSLVVTMIESGSSKITLASMVGGPDHVPPGVAAAAAQLRAVVGQVLDRARAAGVVAASVHVDEVYLLIRGIAHATAIAPPDPATLRRAIDLVVRGLTTPG